MTHSAGWKKLAAMAGLSFLSMYALMYLMVDTRENVIPNINQFYMAAVMTGAMVLIELAVMRAMYEKKVVIFATLTSAIVFIACFAFVRMQTAVSDKEFLKSMIPHHASALLMCKEAELRDPEIRVLCLSIIAGQQQEIDWMREKLSTMK